jgi:hypothetical protein
VEELSVKEQTEVAVAGKAVTVEMVEEQEMGLVLPTQLPGEFQRSQDLH